MVASAQEEREVEGVLDTQEAYMGVESAYWFL